LYCRHGCDNLTNHNPKNPKVMKKFLCNVVMIVCIFSVMKVKEGYGQCNLCAFGSASGTEAVSAGGTANGNKTVALGSSALSSAYAAVSIGEATSTGEVGYSFGNKVFAHGYASFAIGHKVEAATGASFNYVFGRGTDKDNLINNIGNSMMFGMNSDVPTLFLDNSGGTSGSWGNVGIGNITAPASLLHVRDQIRVGLDNEEDGSLVFNNSAGDIITFNTPSALTSHSYTWPDAQATSSSQVLTNDGTGILSWASPGTVSNAWLTTGNGGTNASTNFLGTTDPVDLVIKSDATERMRVLATGNVGIGTTAPVGRLHVNHATANTDVVIQRNGGNAARLRFHTGATPAANLSLTSANDLLMQGLTSNRNLLFNVNRGGTDTEVMRIVGSTANVGIGTPSPAARLHVRATPADVEQFLRLTVNDASLPEAGNHFSVINTTGTADQLGFEIRAINSNTNTLPALTINALVPTIMDTLSTSPIMNFNVRRTPTADIVNRPLFTWNNNGSAQMRMNAAGNLGIGTTTPSGRLHVNGTVFINYGSVPPSSVPGGGTGEEDLGINTAGQLINLSTSSIHFKDNVEDLDFDKESFLNLRPVSFSWKEFYGGNADVGLIAQEVNETFPALASWSYKYTHLDNGDLLRDSLDNPVMDTTQMAVSGVRYHKLPVYLLAIVKEQQQKINALQEQLESLSSLVSDCCDRADDSMHRLDGDSERDEVAVRAEVAFIKDMPTLSQNAPNPFHETTVIRFYVPKGSKDASIRVTDTSGAVIRLFSLNGFGTGSITIEANSMAPGNYPYSLVVDRQMVDTKTMVITR